jgi:hypothetical protein
MSAVIVTIAAMAFSGGAAAASPQEGNASVNFDGEFGYVSGAGASLKPTGNTMTVQMWVKHDGLENSDQQDAVLIEKAGGWEVELRTESSSGGSAGEPKVNFDVGNFGSLNSNEGVPEGEWTHITAVADGNSMSIYINGELAGSKGESGDITNNGASSVRLGTGTSEQSQFFDGRIDEVRVWDTGLSKFDIQTNYFDELNGDEEGLLAYYPVDPSDPSGTLVDHANANDLAIEQGSNTGKVTSPRDAIPVAPYTHAVANNGSVDVSWSHRVGPVGDENPATNYKIYRSTTKDATNPTLVATVGSSTTSYTDTGVSNDQTYYYQVTLVDSNGQESDLPKSQPVRPYTSRGGGSLSLGGGSYATVGDRESLDLTDGTMTAEMWVKHDGESDTDATIFRKGSGSGYHVRMLGAGEERPLEFDIGNFGDLRSTSSGGIHAGEWTHVAVTATGNEMRILINGEVVATKSEGGSVTNNQRPLRIGANDAADGNFFSGNIDDVRVWDTARTPTQIRNNMSRELTGNESDLVGYWRFDEIGASTARGSSTYKSELDLQAGGSTVALEEPGTYPTPPRVYARGGDGSVRIEWSNRAEDVTGYKLYRSTSPDNSNRGQPIETFSGQENAHTDFSVTNGQTYYYEVTAVDADGQESDFAFDATAVPSAGTAPAGNSLEFQDNEPSFGNVTARPSLNINGKELTIQTWVNFDADADDNAQIVRLNGGNYHLVLSGSGASRNIEFDIGRFGDLTSNSGLNAGQWYQVTAVADGNEMSIYIDGELDASKSEGGSIVSSDSNLRLGTDAGENSNFYAGKLDEVMIWDTALSHDRINDTILEERMGNEAGLIAYWRGCNQGDSDTTQGSAVRPMTVDLKNDVACASDGAPLTDDDLQAPTASFTFSPGGPDVDQDVTFDASGSSDPDGQIESYDWEFGFETGSGETTTYAFAEPVEYKVTLTVTDNDGLTDTVSKTVNVGGDPITPTTPTPEPTTPTPDTPTPDTPTPTGSLDLGVEMSGDISVQQGNDATVTAFVNNQNSEATNSVTTELIVDKNNDGEFTQSEVVASRVVDYPGDTNTNVDLTYSDVDLSAGDYEFQVLLSKNTKTVTSFTTSTLTVTTPTPTPLDLGVEMSGDLSVQQGNDATVTAFVNNQNSEATNSVTTELIVDKNKDGAFTQSEVVASKVVNYPGDTNTNVDLTYSDINLPAGDYEFQVLLSKNTKTATSFTTSTLTVTSSGGDAGGVDVSLEPSSRTISPGSSTTYDVVVSGASGGISLFNFSVFFPSDTYDITTASLTESGAGSSITLSSDSSRIEVLSFGQNINTPPGTQVTIATVQVRGDTTGSASLEVEMSELGDFNNDDYSISSTTGATLNVEEGAGPPPIGNNENAPTDPDGDGFYEDLDGRGGFDIFDVQALFVNIDAPDIDGNPAAFNFDESANPQGVDIFDVQALFNELQNQ